MNLEKLQQWLQDYGNDLREVQAFTDFLSFFHE